MELAYNFLLIFLSTMLVTLTVLHLFSLHWLTRLERSLASGHLEEAEKAFHQLLTWVPRRLEFTTIWNRAALDVRLVSPLPPERVRQALLALTRAVARKRPRLIALRRLEAHLLRQEGQLDEARALLESVPRRPHPVDAQQRAIFYELTGDLERALEEYKLALERLDSRWAGTKFGMSRRSQARLRAHLLRSKAQVHTRRGKLDEAVQALEASILSDPRSLEAAYSRVAVAGLLERTRGVEEAERYLLDAIGHAPPWAGLFLQTLGEIQTRAGRYTEAHQSLEQSLARVMVEAAQQLRTGRQISQNPRYLSLMLARFELEMASGQIGAARDLLERLQEQNPEHPLVQLAWAGFYELQGEDTLCVSWLERAVGRADSGLLGEMTRPAARSRLAEAYVRLGRLDDAEAEYRRALRAGEAGPAVRATLGYLLARQGREADANPLFEEAMRDFRQKLQRNPSDSELLAGLGNLLAYRGDLEDAQSYLERAVSSSPRDCAAWSSLGELRQKRNQLPQAREAYRKALELAQRPDQKKSLQSRLAEVEGALPS